MGNKPSSNYQSDRPESGGADRKGERENNGLLEKGQAKFAQEKAEERETGNGNRDSSPESRIPSPGSKPTSGSDRQ